MFGHVGSQWSHGQQSTITSQMMPTNIVHLLHGTCHIMTGFNYPTCWGLMLGFQLQFHITRKG